MLKKTLIIAALAALGATQAYAQKNYTDGGDLYSGSHTNKAGPNQSAAKSGKFDPYTDGAKQSTKSQLNSSGKKFDPNTDGAKAGKYDPYTDGAKAGKTDPYTDGAKAPASQGNKAQ
ncbi:hypothetical protein MKD38_00310 [Cupriavidus sp. WGlv3]|uniref:hypothetical protein n=1 Tax=Cupriavidus sp. WGlv3 TaxID=2919924 RepID=UPI002090B818|nr:hypothetical protein [Cupriavidus sp. WGlv3]MCO4860092.1 hypothetical protein [Cupriavidus sp. WGlv3]